MAPYGKIKKAQRDHERYLRNRDQYLLNKKTQHQINKPVSRDGEPTPDELRQCIKDGRCWWCGREGFRRLAQHTAMMHHITADDIRNDAILLKHTPTCIQEESQKLSVLRHKLLKEGRVKLPTPPLDRTEIVYSQAGLESMRNNALHMRRCTTPEQKRDAIKLSVAATIKPHPCPVCGKVIPHSKPRCCSKLCKDKRLSIGLKIGHDLFNNQYSDVRGRFFAGAAISRKKQMKPPHNCVVCGATIAKTRPRNYCSPECSSNPFNLPIDEIKNMYVGGKSACEIASFYNCNEATIRRQLTKNGIGIRHNTKKKVKV